MRIILLIFVCVFLSYSPLHAVTLIANSCSYADVKAKYDIAAAGDTIQIPAGECDWVSQLKITKAITLKGAGSSSTKINHKFTDSIIDIQPTDDSFIRITGLYICQTTNTYPAIYAKGSITNSFDWHNLRIDHNKFEKGKRTIYTRGRVEGVIDNNIFLNCDIAIGPCGDYTYSWARPIEAGTVHSLFIEDNTFTINNDAGVAGLNEQIYHQEGARTVTRYNLFDGSTYTLTNTLLFDSHGNQDADDFRGQPIIEVYNNTFAAYTTYRMFYLRGGSFLIWGNTLICTTGSPYKFLLADEECFTSGGHWCPICPVSTAWPAMDQIFNSFFWNNTYNGAAITSLSIESDSSLHIQENRDYFMNAPSSSGGLETLTSDPGASNDFCTSSGVPWVCCTGLGSGTCDMTFSSSGANAYYPYYSYTYPHPLRGYDVEADVPYMRIRLGGQ